MIQTAQKNNHKINGEEVTVQSSCSRVTTPHTGMEQGRWGRAGWLHDFLMQCICENK